MATGVTTDGRMRTASAFTTFLDGILAKHRIKMLGAPSTKKDKLPQEYITRRRALRHLQEVLEEDGITHIGRIEQKHVDLAFEQCVESIVPKLDEMPSPNTVRSIISSFGLFIGHHCDGGAIHPTKRKSLLAHMPKVKTFKRHMLIIKGEFWPDIFTIAHKRHIADRVLLELCYYTAMRASEALVVRWQDLKDDGSVHFYRTKRDDYLDLKVHDRLKATLTEYWDWLTDRGLDPQPDWPIVLARDSRAKRKGQKVTPEWPLVPGVPMSYNSARVAIREALLEFGIAPEDMICQALHVARRARACHLYRNGIDIRIIAKLLGHDNHLTTLEYIRDGLDKAEIDAAVNMPDRPNSDLQLAATPVHDPHTTNHLPAIHQTKESLANATLVLLNSGLLSEVEGQAMLLRVMNSCN